jgi:hypothetical protein
LAFGGILSRFSFPEPLLHDTTSFQNVPETIRKCAESVPYDQKNGYINQNPGRMAGWLRLPDDERGMITMLVQLHSVRL